MDDKRELFTTAQAALFLGKAIGTLNNWRQMGRGPAFEHYGSAVLYHRNALETFKAKESPAQKRRTAAIARTNSDYLQVAKRIGAAHPFIEGCALAGIEPTEREVANWRAGKGVALQAAWKRHPKSRTLPRLEEKRRSRTSRTVTRIIRQSDGAVRKSR